MTKTTNPTPGEFSGLQAEVKVAERVCSNARGSKEEKAAGQRVTAASKAILSARPTDPSVMAAQLRFLVAELVVDADARGALENIAEQLEAMRRRPAAVEVGCSPGAGPLAPRRCL